MRVLKIVLVLFWLFLIVLLVREKFFFSGRSNVQPFSLKEGDYWIGIFYQGKRAGFCHIVKKLTSIKLDGELYLNFLGKKECVTLNGLSLIETNGKLNSFSFRVISGKYKFAAHGLADGEEILVKINTGSSSTTQMRINRAHPLGGFCIPEFDELSPGARKKVDLFNPITGMREMMTVEMLGYEYLQGARVGTAKIDYYGSTSKFWIAGDGEILKAEIPPGFTLVREKKENAVCIREVPEEELVDIISTVTVDAGREIENPHLLKKMVVKMDGISFNEVDVNSERQKVLGDGLIEISRASLLKDTLEFPVKDDEFKRFLSPSLLIDSNDEKIMRKASQIAGDEKNLWEAAKKINNWLFKEIRKVPVAGVPSSIQVLDSMEGDCNEHTFLFVALARSIGLPADVCTGLAYYNGKFYYHAWPRVFVGSWIEMDPTLNQPLVDATHIKLIDGGLDRQMALAGIVGKIKLKITKLEYE